ncbi:hypothetical protein [Sphingobium sp.]|uniref:hypothetical protein n=1 Tax=Sphingobium sp. TaxID=1912891 RepID=UPI002CB7D742|nr:hypothetical protein [Sphingobium sp.]HUD95164.1 hypothetical protein [Sphingobium sp.]
MSAESTHGLVPYLPAALLLMAGLSGLATATLLDGRESGRYLVIAPPDASLSDTINLVREADGRLVQAGGFPNIVIAGSNQPDFVASLRKAGAWLVIAAPDRGGCLDPSFRGQAT